MEQQYRPGCKVFKFTFELSGDNWKDKIKMRLAFDRAIENYFNRKPKTIDGSNEPERL